MFLNTRKIVKNTSKKVHDAYLRIFGGGGFDFAIIHSIQIKEKEFNFMPQRWWDLYERSEKS